MVIKRVLFLIPTLGHGGAERVLVNLVNFIDKTRFNVTVQTLFDVGVNKKYLNKDVRYIPGTVKQFRGNSYLMKLFTPEFLCKRIIRDKYDIVVSYLEGPTARIVSGCVGAKKVCWIHIELNSSKLAAVGFRTVSEALCGYKQFDKIISVSQSVEKIFFENLPIETSSQVLYNTNDTEKIRALSKEPEDNVIDSECLSVCSVAKLMQTKGFDRLIEVHKRLINEGIFHKIYILGSGEEEKNLRKKIAEYGIEDTFVLLGFCTNPYKYVSKCSLYVCSSKREGFSTAVTEALILGVPVVSTCCSGAGELLGENNEYGIVTENSEQGIYEGMKRMLTDKSLLEHYKDKAFERGSFFSTEKTVKAVEDMLDNL